MSIYVVFSDGISINVPPLRIREIIIQCISTWENADANDPIKQMSRAQYVAEQIYEAASAKMRDKKDPFSKNDDGTVAVVSVSEPSVDNADLVEEEAAS